MPTESKMDRTKATSDVDEILTALAGTHERSRARMT
jgi:hypothetical protein